MVGCIRLPHLEVRTIQLGLEDYTKDKVKIKMEDNDGTRRNPIRVTGEEMKDRINNSTSFELMAYNKNGYIRDAAKIDGIFYTVGKRSNSLDSK